MTQLDEFASQFLSALKEPYKYSEPDLKTVVFVSDRSPEQARSLSEIAQKYLPKKTIPDFHVLSGEDFNSVKEALEKIEVLKPDLIIAERNLKVTGDNLIYGLSNYVDALTQVCNEPVLLLPEIEPDQLAERVSSFENVMVQTDHLTGDNDLINWGLELTPENGRLVLAHIEDDVSLSHYLDIISKIPDIPTDLAEDRIKQTVLKLPTEFIDRARETIIKVRPDLKPEGKITGIVQLGHTVSVHKHLLESQAIDLLVIHTKVEGQLAMRGVAYSIAVEFREFPILLI